MSTIFYFTRSYSPRSLRFTVRNSIQRVIAAKISLDRLIRDFAHFPNIGRPELLWYLFKDASPIDSSRVADPAVVPLRLICSTQTN